MQPSYVLRHVPRQALSFGHYVLELQITAATCPRSWRFYVMQKPWQRRLFKKSLDKLVVPWNETQLFHWSKNLFQIWSSLVDSKRKLWNVGRFFEFNVKYGFHTISIRSFLKCIRSVLKSRWKSLGEIFNRERTLGIQSFRKNEILLVLNRILISHHRATTRQELKLYGDNR